MRAPRLTVDGIWQHVSASTDVDLEAQSISGTRAPFALPVVPEPVRTASSPTRTPHDAIEDVFGLSQRVSHPSELPPPPYLDAELPAYSAEPDAEPATLPMYLFKFGFLFPPLWLFGAVVLMCPLSPPARFEPSKSETERQERVQIIRGVELRWAKRCAWAFFVLLVFVSMAAAIAAVLLRS